MKEFYYYDFTTVFKGITAKGSGKCMSVCDCGKPDGVY